MLRLSVIASMCYLTFAATISSDKSAVIVSDDYQHLGTGNYQFSYITSNGIERYETGRLVNEGQTNAHIVVLGYFSYKDPNGKTRFRQYIADENGYRILPNSLRDEPDEENLDVDILSNRIDTSVTRRRQISKSAISPCIDNFGSVWEGDEARYNNTVSTNFSTSASITVGRIEYEFHYKR